MIDLVWNFPLFSEQGLEWQGYVRRAVEAMNTADARTLWPSFRGEDTSLRERAGRWLGVETERAWITCGGHHGTLLAMFAAGLAGKPIAVEEVTYTAILEQAAAVGAEPVACAYDGEGMLPDALRAACVARRVRAVFLLPTVHNPLGIVAGLQRRLQLVEIAREFDLTIVEDDAYGFMAPGAPPSYAVLAPERTFFVRGLSKIYAPATRTGFLVSPPGMEAAVTRALKNTTTGTAAALNDAALTLIEDGTLDRVIEAKLTEGSVRNRLGRELLGTAVAPGVDTAWHLWVRLPGTLTGEEAQRLCFERGVLVSGAAGFTAPGATVPRAVRIALGAEVDRERMREGLAIVREVIGRA